MTATSPPLEDLALLGDTRSAALVTRDGDVVWCCMPRFDSPAMFASLLGTEDHGHWSLAPVGADATCTRAYRAESLVLDTTWSTPDGEVVVTDCMPVDGRHRLIRSVRGVRGRIRMGTDIRVRFDYGGVVPWVRSTNGGFSAIGGPDALTVRSDVELHGHDLTTSAEFEVTAGDVVSIGAQWHPSHEPASDTPPPVDAIDGTVRFWDEWIGRCTYDGEFAADVRSSLIVLKGLTYQPTGGLVAAASTSLPEHLGGQRNWDYRYCWLRDATLTLVSLLEAGYVTEAQAWREWLVRTVAGNPADVQVLYGVAGERRVPEQILDWLPGYAGSLPVRIGNGAAGQLQIDVYGEMMDALHQARLAHVDTDDDAWHIQKALLDHLEGHWMDPDEGIWEIRGERQRFTHSKVMAWVAFDRAIKAVERFGLEGPVDRWKTTAAAIHREVCERGVVDGVFRQSFGSTALDAATLVVPAVGFLPPHDPRVAATVDAIQRDLCDDGLVLRYRTESGVDGLEGGEGAFLMCSFWMVDNLALLGRMEEARALYDRLVGLRNDVGLLAEEYDSAAGRLVGNFPQAFSHVALITSATTLCTSTKGVVQRRAEQA